MIAEEIILALGDDVAPESHAFWQYVFVVTELGDEAAKQLVGEVYTVEAAGGMPTRDATRRRTPGGVFLTLAYERLGPKRAKSVRWRATRRAHEDLLRRFLALLTMVAPARPERPLAPATAAPGPAAKAPAVAAPAPKAAAKPARRPEAEPVEVLVVRRRPAASS